VRTHRKKGANRNAQVAHQKKKALEGDTHRAASSRRSTGQHVGDCLDVPRRHSNNPNRVAQSMPKKKQKSNAQRKSKCTAQNKKP
jgi:hypothetical protein